MRAVGLITEYNPFHNGHVYHLQEAKKKTNADVCIVVMSGNFVQRGEPAIIDKYSRCVAAINAGADLVVELPTYYALSSAEGFATGGVKTLAALHTDTICFGSECGDLRSLQKVAQILAKEPAFYKETLKKELAHGNSFPTARQLALTQYLGSTLSEQALTDTHAAQTDQLLTMPNNILAIEYLKAIAKYNLPLSAYTVKRMGSDYHDTNTADHFASATAIRAFIRNCASNENPDANFVFCMQNTPFLPACMQQLFHEAFQHTTPIVMNDCSALLRYKLTTIFFLCDNEPDRIADYLTRYVDITPDLAHRLISCYTGTETCEQLILKIKSKAFTYSRISRCLMHILLEITTDLHDKYEQEDVPYLRILGFSKKGQNYLSHLRKKVTVPLIIKTADNKDLLKEDVYCSDVYNQLILEKFGTCVKNEYRRGVLREE